MDYYELYKKYKSKYRKVKNAKYPKYEQTINEMTKKISGGKSTKKCHKEIFSKIYEKKIWAPNKKTPLSGAGSTINYNKEYINFLQKFINNKKNNIKSILDLGCGDWSFTKDIDFTDKQYLGIDCVPNVIKNNKSKYTKENIHFKLADFSNTSILSHYLDNDLIIMKDVLQHWSDEDIMKTLDFLTQNKRKPRFILIIHGKKKKEDRWKKRSVDNYHHYSNLNFKMEPLKKYGIKHLFDYKFKEVGIIEN